MSEELKPFQRVLVRDYDHNEWHINFFERKYGDYFLCFSGNWKQCLPYTKETAHLLGTTDSPTPPEPEFRFGDKVVVKNAKDGNWCEAIFINYHEKDVAAILRVDPSVISLWHYCRHANWNW